MAPSLTRLLELVGAGEEWKGMPWRVWTPVSEQWRTMPTFVLCEWGYRASCLTALYHAVRTGRKKSWAAAWVCGTGNDIFFMFMPFCDNFWQAQGNVMITPRLPLYVVEMYASVMYYPPVAASLCSRSMGINPVGQACLTGLLAHLYYGVYDVNGPRYMWWTWHDGDPAITERQANAPYGSSLWILTYCAIQSFLNSWILRAPGARLTGALPPTAYDVSASAALRTLSASLPARFGSALQLLQRPASAVDALQRMLGAAPDWVQVLFRAATCTPLFMTLMGQLQLFSLDKLGVPGRRTYWFTLVLMIGVVVQQLLRGRSRAAAPPLPASYRWPNRIFLAAVLGHLLLHTLVNAFGRPERHASTGIHQTVRTRPTTVRDVLGLEREEDLPPTGPHLASRHDYALQPEPGVSKPPGAIDAATEGLNSQWYTIYGKRHRDRAWEFKMGAGLATLGATAFCVAMRKDL
eukprot:TRINITY_DN10932_c0_g1_i1.p1 TRINITY_DN10932_c0_g1~~TRINITY_DN10932_c0_g1_i1.p1  ORF type:complete len:492 (+),score=112.86 TRINITY_DN10932_c0_g1_i1:87-1478(+)